MMIRLNVWSELLENYTSKSHFIYMFWKKYNVRFSFFKNQENWIEFLAIFY